MTKQNIIFIVFFKFSHASYDIINNVELSYREKKDVNQWYKFPCPKHIVSKKKQNKNWSYC